MAPNRWCGYFMLVTALPEAPASRGGEVVSGRHLRLSGAGSKPPAALSLKTFFCSCSIDLRLFFASSAFSFFGICGGRARRAASRHAASSCATEAACRAAPHGRVGIRARAMILALVVTVPSLWADARDGALGTLAMRSHSRPCLVAPQRCARLPTPHTPVRSRRALACFPRAVPAPAPVASLVLGGDVRASSSRASTDLFKLVS